MCGINGMNSEMTISVGTCKSFKAIDVENKQWMTFL